MIFSLGGEARWIFSLPAIYSILNALRGPGKQKGTQVWYTRHAVGRGFGGDNWATVWMLLA